MNHGSSGVLW